MLGPDAVPQDTGEPQRNSDLDRPEYDVVGVSEKGIYNPSLSQYLSYFFSELLSLEVLSTRKVSKKLFQAMKVCGV